MENTARLFNCARCRRQVAICSRCDRGNIYCGSGCSQSARRESRSAAARRYQRTPEGRRTHAERQRRYRARRQKVTHQGSPAPAPSDSLLADSHRSEQRSAPAPSDTAPGVRCCLCGCHCSEFVRQDFLHRRCESQPIPDLPVPPWAARRRGSG